jgi:CRISPR-associated protein Csx3
MQVEGDTLRVGFAPGVRVNGDRLVEDAWLELERLISSGELSGGELLKIDGAASLAVSYSIAYRLCYPEAKYGAIAIRDPKIGTKGKKTYIVAVSESPKYALGQLIETDEPQIEVPKVVLCGPPQSGKSCLREGLKQAIFQLELAPYPYVITACPDGEGSWYSAAAQGDPNLAQKLKADYRAKFTMAFALQAANWVRSANTALNLIDTGGKITKCNRQILREATHAVILYRAELQHQGQRWQKYCQLLKLPVVATIVSRDEDECDRLEIESPILIATVRAFKRGDDISSRPVVQALARLLVSLVPQYPH